MAASALKGSGLTTYVLTFTVPTTGTEVDTLGNTRPKTTTSTVEVYLEPTGNPRIRELVGADVKEVALEGNAVDPNVLPSTVKDGSTASLTIGGRKGTFTLTIGFPSAVAEVDNVMGQPILGKWRAA
jgi:hypothetical protein